MDLHEWKKFQVEKAKLEAKRKLSLGEEATSQILTPEELEEAKQEFEIETFSEAVDFDDYLDLEEVEICEETGCIIETVFVQDQFGEEIDLEFEFEADLLEQNLVKLNEIKELLFAESYEIIYEAEKAKVVFNRGKGGITKTKKCPPGTKLKGKKCIPQTGTDKAGNKRLGIKLKRAKKAMGAGKKKKAALKAKITKKRVAGKARNYSGTEG